MHVYNPRVKMFTHHHRMIGTVLYRCILQMLVTTLCVAMTVDAHQEKDQDLVDIPHAL